MRRTHAAEEPNMPRRLSGTRSALALLVGCMAFCPRACPALVIDEFTDGHVVLHGPETVTQTGLKPEHTIAGTRQLTAARVGDRVEVLPSGGLRYDSTGGYGLGLVYGADAPLNIDTATAGYDRLVLEFSESLNPAARIGDLYINLPPGGSDFGLSFGGALFALGEGGRIEFLLRDVPTSTAVMDTVTIHFSRAFSTGGFELESITLAPTPATGDYDRDGDVDGDDLQVWRRQFGSNSKNGSLAEAYLTADGNYDGVVTAADYTLWRDHAPLAAPSPGTPSLGTPVPEAPAAVMLLSMIGGVAGLRRGAVLVRQDVG